MPTSDQVKALIRSHFESDDERFLTIALQIAAHEARLGHSGFARDIRNYVDKAKRRNGSLPGVNIFRDDNELLLLSRPTERLSALIVDDEIHTRISRILSEYRHRQKLRQHGMTNRRRILLAGPPGTGKTMTASAIAAEIGLPLNTVLMHRMVTKYMGETSAKLAQVFEIVSEEPGIYLFDEFDAIGIQRGREHEVGEMRRVLNSFLQFIEQDDSSSIIIAATNTFDVLDKALFRRFDDVLYYELPDSTQRAQLIRNRLGSFASATIRIDSVTKASESLNHAEIARACEDAIKYVLLSRKKKVDRKLILSMLQHRQEIYNKR